MNGRITRSLLTGLLILAGSWSHAAAAPANPGAVRFNRDIRPILSDNCFACHGPDAKHREAELRLDRKDGLFADLGLGLRVVTPGKPDESALFQRITTADRTELMPPPKSKKPPLTAQQIALVKQWIEQGAEWQGHWSFIAPETPALPQVKNKDWAKNAIDRFILARLEQHGLQPSPEADRPTLIRRVSYDLTGLPPTLAELDRFVADSSDAWYETMVDHYLAKPAYGERMALAWLDAGRYGDTSVFHADGPRDMWPWRDWTINAYNGNMPFDQFTIEQVAGDLLPDATPHQKIASGFNRNHATTDEGGAIAEEWRIEYVVDRVKTTANVWLGLSMECGQCHNHKYDPITQQEYYGFFAFFNQTDDPGMQTRNGNQAPTVQVPDAQRDADIAARQAKMADIDKQIAQHTQAIEPVFEKWVADAAAKVQAGDKPQLPGAPDMIAHFTLDETKGKHATDVVDAKRKGEVKGKVKWQPGKLGGAFHVDRGNWIDFGKDVANFDRTDSISYGCWIRPDDAGNGVPLGKMDDGNAYRGWDLYVNNGHVAVHIINTWPTDAIKVNTKAKVKPKDWTHVFVTYDGSSKAAGVKIYFDGKEQDWTIEQDGLRNTTKGNAPLQVGRRHPGSPFAGLVDDVRIYGRALSPSEVAAVAGADPIAPILALPAGQRTKEQLDTLRSHYLASVDEQYPKLTAAKAKLSAEIEGLKKNTITSMVMGEQAKPRQTYLLMRGHYASPDKSAAIEPDVPSVFPPLPEGSPRNRLGLAKWMMSDENPLTARVAVNRYWAMIFGSGLVATVTDFGTQGAWPSHPELLDWLAVDFRDNGGGGTGGWNVKRTIKQILMSATYRQSSRITPQLREADPENRLLARGPRFRLQGEFIRDTALAASGLLVDQLGGPGVKPYQPPGLWNEVSLDGGLRFVQDKGDKLYRKSMYIYWKRSAPHPGMLLFDAPTREACIVQRPITNTPLQALYTMNDTQFVEAARVLARRMMTQGENTPRDRIVFAYRLATSREPGDTAVAVLLDLFNTEHAKYQADPEKAKQLLANGEAPRDEKLDQAEHAAWTIVASTILNLDAAVTKY